VEHSVMEEGVVDRMMEVNGGIKAIPTILVNDQVVIGYDRLKLKELLGIA
jgi:2-hydroxychromene-2-carboxylate isomerase